MALNKDELLRFERQIILPEMGVEVQERFKSAKILLVGLGGLGCPALQYLAAAGIGQLGLVDADVVEMSNLHRQILYSQHDIGKPKVEVAKAKALLLYPNLNIQTFQVRIDAKNIDEILAQYDVVIDGSDNFTTRYVVNDACVSHQKPLVFGSILKFEGQVSVFNYQNGPNYRDVFPEAPEDVPNCAEIGVLGVLPGIVGNLMAAEALKVVGHFGEVLSGKLLIFNLLEQSYKFFHFKPTNTKILLPQSDALKPKQVESISITALQNQVEAMQHRLLLVDVREPWEFEDFNIGGINIPLAELNEQLHDLPQAEQIVFCCASGQRSKIAAQLATKALKCEIFHLQNGINSLK